MTGDGFAEQARSAIYTGIPYSKLDCQGFVERVLKDCGVRNASGYPYNWRGSNSMWRNALSWKGTIKDCLDRYGCIPMGAWVFIVKNDGGEVKRGYHDNEGNAAHVGIYCAHADLEVRDSTRTRNRDGVGYRELDGFTHVGLCKYLDYGNGDKTILTHIHTVRDSNSTDTEYLTSLTAIVNYFKGV